MKGRMTQIACGVAAVCAVAVIPLVSSLSQGREAGVTKEQLTRGEKLVNFGGCNDCHSPKLFTAKGPVPDTSRLLSGHPAGSKLPDIPQGVIGPDKWGAICSNDMTAWVGPWGVSFASNLTSDPGTGLGAWTDNAFIQTMRTGKHKGVLRDILPPMPWYDISYLTDQELKDVLAYLKSVKPIVNKVPEPISPK